jgi:hypothetical protein
MVLFERFVETTGEVMAAAGWSADASGRASMAARFVRSTEGGFVATASLEPGRGPIHGSRSGRAEPPLDASAWVGASHGLADRLVRAASGARGWGPAVAVDVDELLDPPREVQVPVATIDEVRPAVELLVGLIEEVAVPFASARASFDALIGELRAGDDTPAAQRYVPALLAASGRTEAAREALARYSTPAGAAGYRGFASQLTRLLDGEVTLEELEAAIAPEPELPEREPVTWQASADRVKSERAAVDAGRSVGGSVTRDRRRELLRAELERRELQKSPAWIEAKLDQLEPGYQAPSALSGIVALGKFAFELTRVIKNVKEPSDEPDWLAPPERACYKIFTLSRDRVSVELDHDARQWLDRVHAAAPHVLNSATVTVWLDRDREASADQPRLIVSIGDRRIGRLDSLASAAFAASMTAAEIRNELPFASATLWRRTTEPKYLLEIPTPQDRQTRG